METGVSASQHSMPNTGAHTAAVQTPRSYMHGCCRASANADLLQGRRFYKRVELHLEAGKTAHPEYCFEGMETGVDRVDKLLVWLAGMVGSCHSP